MSAEKELNKWIAKQNESVHRAVSEPILLVIKAAHDVHQLTEHPEICHRVVTQVVKSLADILENIRLNSPLSPEQFKQALRDGRMQCKAALAPEPSDSEIDKKSDELFEALKKDLGREG